jgi:hypothetical protein
MVWARPPIRRDSFCSSHRSISSLSTWTDGTSGTVVPGGEHGEPRKGSAPLDQQLLANTARVTHLEILILNCARAMLLGSLAAG